AFSGVLQPSELTGDRVHQALDLCVECKACAAECPSGVDMAKLKYEVLAQRNHVRGVPLRSRLFAHIGALARLGVRVAPLANWGAGLPPVRRLLQRFGGIHAERPLPRFATRSFASWFRARPAASRPAPRGEVVLFDDT